MENSQTYYTRSEPNKSNESFANGLIIRQKEPNNLETPVDRVDSFLTPTELFYVRSHSRTPKIELASYRSRHLRRIRHTQCLALPGREKPK